MSIFELARSEFRKQVALIVFLLVLSGLALGLYGYLLIDKLHKTSGLLATYDRRATLAENAWNDIRSRFGPTGLRHDLDTYLQHPDDQRAAARVRDGLAVARVAIRDHGRYAGADAGSAEALQRLSTSLDVYQHVFTAAAPPRAAAHGEFDSRLATVDTAVGQGIARLAAQRPPQGVPGQGEVSHRIGETARLISYGVILFPLLVAIGFLIIRLLARLHDTNDRMLASWSHLDSLINAMPDATLVIDSEGYIVRCNGKALELLGYSQSQLRLMTVEQLMPPRYRERHVQKRGDYFSEPRTRKIDSGKSFTAITVNNEEIPLDISLNYLRQHNQTYAIASLRDARNRLHTEQELKTDNKYLEKVVAERTRDLLIAKEAAERAYQVKSEFLSRMSHELRTPLNAILGFGQLLAMKNLDTDSREDVGHILSAGNHLLLLIDDILDIAKIEAGKVSLEIEPLSLAETVSECLAIIGSLASERNIQVDVSLAEEQIVLADRKRLRQILLNLLSNAVKYNDEHGSISVTSSSTGEDNRILIRISDTGSGIDQDTQQHMFQPFERGQAEQSQIPGTGIGLAVAKNFAEMMAGSISCSSDPGKGSTFQLELPAPGGQSREERA